MHIVLGVYFLCSISIVHSTGDKLSTLMRPGFMMTSSHGNIFRVTGHLCGEFTGPGEFPTQRPVTRGFDVFFYLRLNNGCVNNRKAGVLRRYRAHCDVIVMWNLGVCTDWMPAHKPTELPWINQNFNPLPATFLRGNINLYLHFVLFPHIYTTQVVEILPQIRQEPTYST